ncbi:hypothetical protein [Streptomyces sp. NPDC005408]
MRSELTRTGPVLVGVMALALLAGGCTTTSGPAVDTLTREVL